MEPNFTSPTPVPTPPAPQTSLAPAHHTVRWAMLLTIAVVLVGGYFAFAKYQALWPFTPTETPIASVTPRPSSTANWKMYTSAQGDYTLKYPEGWTISGPTFLMTLTSDGNGPAMRINNALENYNAYLSTSNQPAPREFSISGGKGYYFLNTTPDGPQPEAYLVSDNHVYLATYTLGRNESLADAERIFLQILSTFTFTSPTAGWKTYTNSQYGFEFKYPGSLTRTEPATVVNTNGETVRFDLNEGTKKVLGVVLQQVAVADQIGCVSGQQNLGAYVIDGRQAKKCTPAVWGGQNDWEVTAGIQNSKGVLIYTFTCFNNEPRCDQILATFRFNK